MKKPEEYKWTTAQGEQMTFGQMASDHLLNVCRFLKRGIDTAEAFDGKCHPRQKEALAAAKAVASKRGLLIDGRVPTFSEESALAELKMRESLADDPLRQAVRDGIRPLDVEGDQ